MTKSFLETITPSIINLWKIFSTNSVLYSHQLAEIQTHFYTFFTHQIISFTERMSIHQSPYKVRFTSSPYQPEFLKLLHKNIIPSSRVEIQFAVEEFLFYCLENIYQHAGTKGYAMLNITDDNININVFDKGPGIADIDNDQIPDILEAIKPNVSLHRIGSKGMGLTKAIQLADDFHLFSNGYFWNKADPEEVSKTEFDTNGVCIIARISTKTALKQPRQYLMI